MMAVSRGGNVFDLLTCALRLLQLDQVVRWSVGSKAPFARQGTMKKCTMQAEGKGYLFGNGTCGLSSVDTMPQTVAPKLLDGLNIRRRDHKINEHLPQSHVCCCRLSCPVPCKLEVGSRVSVHFVPRGDNGAYLPILPCGSKKFNAGCVVRTSWSIIYG
jgi:hypothetical protein